MVAKECHELTRQRTDEKEIVILVLTNVFYVVFGFLDINLWDNAE